MATFTNEGTLNLRNNGLDGLHVGKGASFENRGEINAEGNGRHGIFIYAEAVAALKKDIGEAEEFLEMPKLAFLRAELQPLIADVKNELSKAQPSSSFISKGISTMKDLLAKAAGSAAGSMALQGLQHLIEHAHAVAAHL